MQDLRSRLLALGAFLILVMVGGCASPVPGSVGTGSGRSIAMTITCYSAMYPQYYYYFLINRFGSTGNQNARGPIPVLDSALANSPSTGYGNGFATGSQNASGLQGDTGLTDYVVYNSTGSPSGPIGLWHIYGPVDIPNPGTFVSVPSPVMLPDSNNVDVNQATTLSVTIHVSQLLTTTETKGLTPAQITALANQIRWLQVNLVATDKVPTTQTGTMGKLVDSMGDSRFSVQLTSFLVLDLSQNPKITDEGTFPTLLFPEPQGDILVPPGAQYNPSIDIVHWSIRVSSQ